MSFTCKTIGCSNEVEETLTDHCNACLVHFEPTDQYLIGAGSALSSGIVRHVVDSKETNREETDFKDVSDVNEIDVYYVHYLFDMNDSSGALQEASRKLLLCGGPDRCAYQDVEEVRNILNRWLQFAEPNTA